MVARKMRKGLSYSLLVLWSMLRVSWGNIHLQQWLPFPFASILNDFWLHSLILPFPSTEKQWLSALYMTLGAGCCVRKANTPSMGVSAEILSTVGLSVTHRELGSVPAEGITG